MRKRIVIAAVCILALPLLFSPFSNDGLTSPSASSVVAVAGHNNMGNFCECGTSGCIAIPVSSPSAKGFHLYLIETVNLATKVHPREVRVERRASISGQAR